MIASMLRIPIAPEGSGADLFRRFTKVRGVVASYRLQPDDGSAETLVFTIWDSEQSREAYNKDSDLRQEVDKAFPGGQRTIYRVLDSK